MNILFDLDGTLTNPREGIVGCIQYALSEQRAPVRTAKELERFIGPPLRDAFRELIGADVVQIEAAVAAYRERFESVGMFQNAVYGGVPEVLDALASRNARLFVATSKPRVFAVRILDHFGLGKYFDAIYGSELDGALSEKSELIAHVLERSGLDHAATTMIGDRHHDIRGAQRNHVRAAGVLWGYGSREELTSAGADVLYQDPEELVQLVV